ncbi:AAA family ATPase [Curvibacter sp. APW13]|uniref:ExeA family protein n=1 Tax=Curvibacter sp. APW13 TaxID=3077236 RepID=UPI0028DE1C93|nr:AAA family ATPase [Curvibacter sp. APW13]MDT8990210.1 AAA family ATPase [Curvibacter sp. APW13]
MYLGHFGLREAPFSITPDTDFFFAHEGAQASLNTLLVALRSGEGFIKVVGELGCGKTVLCRQLLRLLQDECVTAYIPNPDMGPDDLIMALLHELSIEVPTPATRHAIQEALRAALVQHASQGRRVVVCIDEAQAIPLRSIESLRLLSNLETEKRKLIQLVLLGQPDLDTKLERPEIRQLLQRITFSEYLGPMAAQRVPAYLAHRLRCAALDDSTEVEVFDRAAAQLLARYSGGTPRLINVLAHKCLMLAYGEASHRVQARHVHLAARDTPAVAPLPPWWRRWWPRSASRRGRARGVDDSFGAGMS